MIKSLTFWAAGLSLCAAAFLCAVYWLNIFFYIPDRLIALATAPGIFGCVILYLACYTASQFPAEKHHYFTRIYNYFLAGDGREWILGGTPVILFLVYYVVPTELGEAGVRLSKMALFFLVGWAALLLFAGKEAVRIRQWKELRKGGWVVKCKQFFQHGGVLVGSLLLYTTTLFLDNILGWAGFVNMVFFTTVMFVYGLIAMVVGGVTLMKWNTSHPDRFVVHMLGGTFAFFMCGFALHEIFAGSHLYSESRSRVPFLGLLLFMWMCTIPTLMKLVVPKRLAVKTK